MFSKTFLLSSFLISYRRFSYNLRHSGIEILRNPRINRGTAFSLRERQLLGLQGLLPPTESTQSNQIVRILDNLKNSCENDLSRFNYLMSLQDRNENLFFKTVIENVEYCMPLVYTPTVGLACKSYGLVFRRPRGLYITIHDMDHISDILDNWFEASVRIIVVTDGERILGLGDLGAYGMGIPVGKLNLYTALGGIKPDLCLPILLDVGTNNEELIADPNYIGLRKHRTTGPEYEAFIDKFMLSITEKFGPNVLIQFEDFANHNAFHFLNKYKKDYCTFNDDIQGTAAVALGGLLAGMRLLQNKLSNQKYLFAGAGEASIGIANLLIKLMKEDDGISEEEAISKIFMVDSKGLLVQNRSGEKLIGHKVKFAHDIPHIENLRDIVEHIKPTALIGAAAVGKVFSKEIIQMMAKFNDRPIIFALSNPVDRAECTAQEAYEYTDGRCLFASGSPFAPVTLSDGRTFTPSTGHNAYLFPGIGFAVTTAHIQPISDGLFLVAAKTLAEYNEMEDLEKGSLYPRVQDIPKLSTVVSKNCIEYAYKHKMASHYPEPIDKDGFLKRRQYSADYKEAVPFPYSWPPGVTDRI